MIDVHRAQESVDRLWRLLQRDIYYGWVIVLALACTETISWGVLVVPVWLACTWGWGLYWAWGFASAYSVVLAFALLLRFRQGTWKDMRVIELHLVPHGEPLE